MEKMKCELGRLKARGAEERGTRRLKARGGEEERHALAKPRLVAVLRSKLRFTCFLQVPTGSHCLSPPPLSFGLLVSRLLTALLSISLHLPKCRQVHIVFLRLPLLQAIGLPTSPFSLLSPSTDGLTLSFSAPLPFGLLDCLLSLSLYFPQVPTGSHCLSPPPPLLQAIGLPHSPKLLLNLNYIERKKHYFETIYLTFVSFYCILILFSLL